MRRQVLVGLAVATAVGLGTAATANAEVTTPAGTCVATAAFLGGTSKGPFTVDTRTLQPSDVVLVPIADTVSWTGQLVGATPTARPVSGYIAVDLPWPLGTVTVDSWEGTTSLVENSGTDDYSLPSATPRGIEVQVRGVHRENGAVVCSATVTVEIEGSPFDSPAAIVSLGGLAASGVALAMAGRAKYRSVG